MVRKIAEGILQKVLGSLTEILHEAVIDAVGEIIRGFLRRLVLALLGAFLIVFGVLLLFLGLIRFLAVFFPEWLAWTIVGLLIAILGFAFLLASMPRRKH